MLRKLLQPFYTTYVVVTFLLSLAVVFPLVAIVSLANNAKGRKVIHFIIKRWAIIWLYVIGMPVRIKGAVPQDGNYVFVANHISYIDTISIFPAVRRYFRPLGKKEMSKAPLVGYIYKQITIMVDRSNTVSRAVSMRLMSRALRKESSIIIFPEGTFNETPAPLKDFYDGAFRLAITCQKDIVPVILPDSLLRWHYSAWWKLWPGNNRAIYLPPVSVAGMDMKDLPRLKEQVFAQMETALIEHANYLKP